MAPPNKSDWYFADAKEKIGRYKCIKNRVTLETMLVGKYGEIWMHSDSVCCAWITSNIIINKYTAPKEKYKAGEERIFKFPISELDNWVKILGVKNNRKGMIRKADSVREV